VYKLAVQERRVLTQMGVEWGEVVELVDPWPFLFLLDHLLRLD
jgi:hypothetical protein